MTPGELEKMSELESVGMVGDVKEDEAEGGGCKSVINAETLSENDLATTPS